MASKTKHQFISPDGEILAMSSLNKFYRDIISHSTDSVDALSTTYDPVNPNLRLRMCRTSPICRKCGLDDLGATNPYMPPAGAGEKGSAPPLVTVIFDGVSFKEDANNALTSAGSAGFFKTLLKEACQEAKVDVSQIRWVPLTRCAASGTRPNFKIKGNWCRHYLVQDLKDNPPQLIMPIGSAALGALSHKSSAQDWSGRLLTYRGWPDDWFTNPVFSLPRKNPAGGESITGHPLMGPQPNVRIPMVPLQAPRLVWATQNPSTIIRWKKQLVNALKIAAAGVQAPTYTREWYNVSTNVDIIKRELQDLISRPGQLLAYDTETTGLKAWAPGAAIVFMMFRWRDAEGRPRSIGFPWDYAESPLKDHIPALAPIVLEALYNSKVVGHNLTFDILFTSANVPGANLDRLADAAYFDTWHMAFVSRQMAGSLGLEILAYDYAPDLAGYEEEMTLLIDLMPELLHPGAGAGGHYAKCPEDKWETHLVPYVMGDVEVAYQAYGKLKDKLAKCKTYKIPLAHTRFRGQFRQFAPPSREWAYENIISPGSRLLIKMMGRGMYVDREELENQEDLYPKRIRDLRQKLRVADSQIVEWCETQEHTIPGWELDLENQGQLKAILFEQLRLPVQRLTDAGKEIYGERPEDLEDVPAEDKIRYAAVDKFTLNKLAVNHPQVRPLQEYKRAFKEWSTYVRPVRNVMVGGIDKTARKKDPYLARDGCVHTSFLVTGTRSGRLSSREPNLQAITRDGIVKRLYASRFGKERGFVYQADLSQIELRLLAAACGDEGMVKAYLDGIDLHALTHSKIYGKPYDQCTSKYSEELQKKGGHDKLVKILKEERKVSKTANFLTGYGGGAFGLQTSLADQGIYKQLAECEQILESFFDAYPAMKRYLSLYKRFIADHGVAVSLFGRVRIFEEVFSEDKEAASKALRAGCNHLIQSTASDMMLACLTAIEAVMRSESLESVLVSTVHDSLVIDTVKSEIQVVHEIVSEILSNMPAVLKTMFGQSYDDSWLQIVPFEGDSEIGRNYLDAVKIAKKDPDWDLILRLVDSDEA